MVIVIGELTTRMLPLDRCEWINDEYFVKERFNITYQPLVLPTPLNKLYEYNGISNLNPLVVTPERIQPEITLT